MSTTFNKYLFKHSIILVNLLYMFFLIVIIMFMKKKMVKILFKCL